MNKLLALLFFIFKDAKLFINKSDGFNDVPITNITHKPQLLYESKLLLDKLKKKDVTHYEMIILIKENQYLLDDIYYKTYRYNISKNLFF
jgi:hypothetical protein